MKASVRHNVIIFVTRLGEKKESKRFAIMSYLRLKLGYDYLRKLILIDVFSC